VQLGLTSDKGDVQLTFKLYQLSELKGIEKRQMPDVTFITYV